jgi:hypothetical protein
LRITLLFGLPQEVQSVLLSAVATHGSAKPYSNSAYLAGLKARAAELEVSAASRRLAQLEAQLAAMQEQARRPTCSA